METSFKLFFLITRSVTGLELYVCNYMLVSHCHLYNSKMMYHHYRLVYYISQMKNFVSNQVILTKQVMCETFTNFLWKCYIMLHNCNKHYIQIKMLCCLSNPKYVVLKYDLTEKKDPVCYCMKTKNAIFSTKIY